ncbi:MAG: dynamin family protein [Anaerolineales bacterium]|nr:dynamin family protein [Anaerolineales bacterium]
MHILNEQQEVLLNEERDFLNQLRVALVAFGAASEDQATLGQSIRQLDDLFLLVVVGEFNSGKSAFINALLGQKILKEGVTPTTTQINILRYGLQRERYVQSEHLHTMTAPLDLLKEISIVDTPGTNAIIREHEAVTTLFVPRSDLVLFITSADRPFTESERAFLERIRDWGKKVVIVLNKIDLFETAAELEQVERFITDNALSLLGMTPEIFPVSARNALRAKLGEPILWQSSRFGSLEKYIQDTLDEGERVRLKLLSPLGVGMSLLNRYLGVIENRSNLLQTDLNMLKEVDDQLAVYREDMRRDFAFRMSDIENILYELEQRGQDYFDETIRLGRIFDLVKKERIQQEFARQVVGDVPERIEAKANEMIDWLVDADFRQWQAVMEHLAGQRRQHQEHILGDVGVGSFHHDRERLIEGVGHAARRVVETYDKAREAQLIAEGAQTAVAATAALEVGAVGLGTLIYILASTAAADATGILLASLVAALGLFVIPARKRQAKKEMREKIAALREQLAGALRTQFEGEIVRSLGKIQKAIAPYSRFVRTERGKLDQARQELEDIKAGLNRLKVAIEEKN